ncbi:MAG: glutamate-5-semialdehyde dehydrogenase [Myxococcota bacterium]
MKECAEGARRAQREATRAGAPARTRSLEKLRALLEARWPDVAAANQTDLRAAEEDGLEPALLQRLGMDGKKRSALLDGLQVLIEAEDPVGRTLRHIELEPGLRLRQVTHPIGVLLVVYESRPDAGLQIGGLAMRSGNAVILKGGREAEHTNHVLATLMQDALETSGLPREMVQAVVGRGAVEALLQEDACIDLVIPRGSANLVRSIQQSTRIPVLGHAEGICHTYFDAAADPERALRIILDAKCDAPSTCNATETLLVHRDFVPQVGPILRALLERGVELRVEPPDLIPFARPAGQQDWRTEHGRLVLGVRVVPSLDAAIDHIHRYGSAHTECIVTEDEDAARRFLEQVDSASVFHNASTRFADGYRYGLGAEVGISTGRIHARGPVGADGLLTTRWLLQGEGQVASDFGPGEGQRRYVHRALQP